MADAKRERSTIKFPYGDLDDAVEVARRIDAQYGRSCSIDQLAAAFHQTISSGAFRTRVATASTFGVVEGARKQVNLTDLGIRIIDPQTEGVARAQAFLKVPLYRKVYERFRGSRLPEDAGLQAEIVRLGVSSRQAPRARQALQRSAEQAEFLAQGRDRLVMPAAAPPEQSASEEEAPQELEEHVPELAKHPLLVGLWQMLPEPGSGFSPDEQEAWLEAARVNLKLLYGPGQPSGRPPTRPSAPEGG